VTPPPTLLAIDLGTQSLRLTALSTDGRRGWSWSAPVASRISGEIDEQDPAEWSALLATALAEAARAGIRPDAIAAAGPLAGWVPLAADGTAIGPAAMYFDRRAALHLAAVDAALADRPHALRPTVADPLPQMLRLRSERPEVHARTACLLDATGWLVRELTGAATLDAYTALRLYDPVVRARLAVEAASFGRPVAVGEVVAPLRAPLAAGFGGRPIPVVAATFDSKCAYLASGIAAEGEALDISGTVTSFGVVAPRPVEDAARRIYSVPFDGGWLVRGSMSGAGSILEWARRSLFGMELEAIEAAAAEAPPGAAGVTFLPYHSGIRSPLWNPHARGAFVGLSLDAGRPALARAVFEGLAFALRHIADAMAGCAVRISDVRLAGGLARSRLLAQLKADVLGRPMIRCADHELTTLGLAVIAAVAIGAFPDRQAASRALVGMADRVVPGPAAGAYDAAYRRYLDAVAALEPTFGRAPAADPRSPA